jgi:nitrogen fixation/metabolism regulation signal transduction histidine kinase
MIASSRPEIFEKGLSGNYMNPEAYFQLAKNNKPESTIEETIGMFQYSSVYSPFINDNDKLLAYLNLPYFTRQSALKQEISSLLLTIINFYVLLIMLSVSFAVFVSEQITKPLRYIRERFATIKLGAGVEKIQYKNHDEIGELVEEYNRMVDELERSLELLAKSERESAWREMAKQIAHEIKNPLTPMKLSIQQLQRAWDDKSENLDAYFSRVTKTLVEQIDNLSKIATEFSDFAKIPKPSFEKINLESLLPGIIDLFAQSGSKFILHYNKKQQFPVMVDKEQISRVFINLATNAVQAIPEGRQGIIEILLTHTDKDILVTFHDNGSGIPEEMSDKLFQPSFTTKSGGMGLGLAISKNIVENSGGQITCNSIPGEGTTFVFTLPVYSI